MATYKIGDVVQVVKCNYISLTVFIGPVVKVLEDEGKRTVYEVELPNNFSDRSLPFWEHELRHATDAEAFESWYSGVIRSNTLEFLIDFVRTDKTFGLDFRLCRPATDAEILKWRLTR